MRAAVYYPHISIEDERLVKTALLLWDFVECIVPGDQGYVRNPTMRTLRPALSLIARERSPTTEEQLQAHGRIVDLVRRHRDHFQAFIRGLARGGLGGFEEPHLVYPRKFLYDTWEFLEGEELVQWRDQSGGYDTIPALAVSMMSILADCMAGNEMVTITDRSAAYGALTGFLSAEAGMPPGAMMGAAEVHAIRGVPQDDSEAYLRLAAVSLKLVDTDGLEMDTLLRMREREAGGDIGIARMRQTYVSALESYIQRIRAARNANDVREVDRQYEMDMKESLRQLQAELKTTRLQSLTSSNVCAVLPIAGSALAAFVDPTAGSASLSLTIPAALGLYNQRAQYREQRQQALERQPMSWLHIAARDRHRGSAGRLRR